MTQQLSPPTEPESPQSESPERSSLPWLVRFLVGAETRFQTWFDQLPSWGVWLLCLGLLILALPLIVTPLRVWQQGLVAVMVLALGQLVLRAEQAAAQPRVSEYLHLFLIGVSGLTTLRYFYYRTAYTINASSTPDLIASVLLYAAESYAILTLFLSFFQTLRLRDREPVSMADLPVETWPRVDVYIPTYNEDVAIVRKTVVAALAIDYPADKKRVYVLDDGRAEKYRDRRQALKAMCDELGCGFLTRDSNEHAKAGNINTAMQRTNGDLVLILDCDHIPVRHFLMETVGFFRDEQVALVQTPHWFYNPDPFERNLLTKGSVPVNNELFYKVLQKGNDYWNAAFFCGSAAVIRREVVLSVGGIAVETVTEDCHTALRLHEIGYKSVYYDRVMVAGLAPETCASYIGQQVRWARGMAQILRIENPLFNRRLTLPQRICYFSATSHFFYGWPRLMYAVAPTLFLLFGINPIRGLGVETLLYALPHIVLSLNANYISHKHVRYSFWNELFEFVLAFQTGIVTVLALINPKMGTFNVTSKGVEVSKRNFDWRSVQGILVVWGLVVLALAAVPFWLFLRPEDIEAILVNGGWSVFNLLLLTAALVVALEQPQLRRAHRLERKLSATLVGDGQSFVGRTINISETGAQIQLAIAPEQVPAEVDLTIVGDYGAKVELTAATVLRAGLGPDGETVATVDFGKMSQAQQDALVLVIYADVKEWYSQSREEQDRPSNSIFFLATSLGRALQDFRPLERFQASKALQISAQILWQGAIYQGTLTSLTTTSASLDMSGLSDLDIQDLMQGKPLIGLTLVGNGSNLLPRNLVAEVQDLRPSSGQGVIELEVRFPQTLRSQQDAKIREVLAVI